MNTEITERSHQLFMAYANDAGNWGGTPLVGGNVENTAEDRGNLTQLKKAGLIETSTDEGSIWIKFTSKGKDYAKLHNVEIYN